MRSMSLAAVVAVAAVPFAAAVAQAAPTMPSGHFRGTTPTGGGVIVDVHGGKVYGTSISMPMYCPAPSNISEPKGAPTTSVGTDVIAKLKATAKGYTFTVTQGDAKVTGTFSANGKSLTGTASGESDSVEADGQVVQCGTTQNSDGTVSTNPVSFTAKLAYAS
jgi:hypothetical protein